MKMRLAGGPWVKNALLCASVACVCGAALAGCGGAQKPSSNPCDEDLSQILGADPGEYCDMMGVERFERLVGQWRDECGGRGKKKKKKLAKKLSAIRRCAEKRSRMESLHASCTQQIQEVELNADCIGQACVPFVDYTRNIVRDCSDPDLDGKYKARAEELVRQLQERIDEADGLAAIRKVSEFCTRTAERVKRSNARSLLNRILKRLKKSPGTANPQPQGSELEKERNAALASCEQAVLPAVTHIADDLSEGLSPEEMERSRRRWERRFRELEKIRERVASVDAAFFADSIELLDRTLQTADPEYQSPQPSEPKQPEQTAQEQPAPGGDPDEDRRFFENSRNRCEKMAKKISQYQRKFEEYQEKDNPRKSGAYAKKLEQEQEKRSALRAEIDRVVQKTALPAEELEPLLSRLAKAGCSTAAAQ